MDFFYMKMGSHGCKLFSAELSRHTQATCKKVGKKITKICFYAGCIDT